MNTLGTAALLWIKTLFFNAITGGFLFLFTEGILALPLGVAFFIVGAVITAPLLILVVPLLNLFKKIDYAVEDKLPWLAFMLIALSGVFFAAVQYALQEPKLFSDENVQLLFTSVAISCSIAVWLTRQRLQLFNES